MLQGDLEEPILFSLHEGFNASFTEKICVENHISSFSTDKTYRPLKNQLWFLEDYEKYLNKKILTKL